MNEVLNNLVWIGRCVNNHGSAKTDIHITTNLTDGKRDYVSFTFKNDIWKLFADDTCYFEVSLFKNRMFFRKSTAERGITLSTNKNCTLPTTRYAKVQNSTQPKLFAGWGGDYELKHDDFYDLYYIERKDEV